jgi:Zn-dependent protease
MDAKLIIDGLILYLALLVLLTFHEFGHAWMASRCGDDTARLEGRVSLNPIVHIDLLGTVILPLIMIFFSPIGQFLVGWAKPVPVNTNNLRHKTRDDILVTLAGPGMNLLLGFALLVLARVGMLAGSESAVDVFSDIARLSLLLCFFNLLPIPPLDGSQVARVIFNVSHETYYRVAQYGFFILIVALQIPYVRMVIGIATGVTYVTMGRLVGLPIG